jgi:hypothetical protein
MRELLPPAMALIVGGRAAAGYKEKLTDADIRWVGCLHGLDNELLQIRK